MTPEPGNVQDFIRTLSGEEVRKLLEADPLGSAFILCERAESDLRWRLFDVLISRPVFFEEAKAEKAAALACSRAQMLLPFGREVAC